MEVILKKWQYAFENNTLITPSCKIQLVGGIWLLNILKNQQLAEYGVECKQCI